MCLHKVYKVYDTPNPEVRIGYKIFHVLNDGGVMSPCQATQFVIGEIYHDSRTEELIYVNDLMMWPERYPTGYHIFTDLDGAKNHWLFSDNKVIYKVEYTNTVVEGVDSRSNTDVARTIRVLERVEI